MSQDYNQCLVSHSAFTINLLFSYLCFSVDRLLRRSLKLEENSVSSTHTRLKVGKQREKFCRIWPSSSSLV